MGTGCRRGVRGLNVVTTFSDNDISAYSGRPQPGRAPKSS
jgi:hypothetical protein